jgi:hypothetical protein
MSVIVGLDGVEDNGGEGLRWYWGAVKIGDGVGVGCGLRHWVVD